MWISAIAVGFEGICFKKVEVRKSGPVSIQFKNCAVAEPAAGIGGAVKGIAGKK